MKVGAWKVFIPFPLSQRCSYGSCSSILNFSTFKMVFSSRLAFISDEALELEPGDCNNTRAKSFDSLCIPRGSRVVWLDFFVDEWKNVTTIHCLSSFSSHSLLKELRRPPTSGQAELSESLIRVDATPSAPVVLSKLTLVVSVIWNPILQENDLLLLGLKPPPWGVFYCCHFC